MREVFVVKAKLPVFVDDEGEIESDDQVLTICGSQSGYITEELFDDTSKALFGDLDELLVDHPLQALLFDEEQVASYKAFELMHDIKTHIFDTDKVFEIKVVRLEISEHTTDHTFKFGQCELD